VAARGLIPGGSSRWRRNEEGLRRGGGCLWAAGAEVSRLERGSRAPLQRPLRLAGAVVGWLRHTASVLEVEVCMASGGAVAAPSRMGCRTAVAVAWECRAVSVQGVGALGVSGWWI
jgi:hypothetical protein